MIDTRTPHFDGKPFGIKDGPEVTPGRCFAGTNPLQHESSIVWTEDISRLDFVRVAVIRNARSRRGRLMLDDPRVTVVGYSKLLESAPADPQSDLFTRRIFYLREEDSRLNMNAFPMMAIDPKTVGPGLAGEKPRTDERGYPFYLRRS